MNAPACLRVRGACTMVHCACDRCFKGPLMQYRNNFKHCSISSSYVPILRPPQWRSRWHARLSRSGPGFDPRDKFLGWGFFGVFLTCKTMPGSFRTTSSSNIIWPHNHPLVFTLLEWKGAWMQWRHVMTSVGLLRLYLCNSWTWVRFLLPTCSCSTPTYVIMQLHCVNVVYRFSCLCCFGGSPGIELIPHPGRPSISLCGQKSIHVI